MSNNNTFILNFIKLLKSKEADYNNIKNQVVSAIGHILKMMELNMLAFSVALKIQMDYMKKYIKGEITEF